MAGKLVVATGVDELDNALKRLEPRLQKKLARKATRKAAKDIVLPAARASVPVDTGDLRRSLTVRAVTKTRGRRVGHTVRTRDTMFAGDQYYGGMLEFGTKHRQTKQGYNRGAVTELRFLRNALYENETKVRLLFREAMRQFIREA